jgi:hypothetical protein
MRQFNFRFWIVDFGMWIPTCAGMTDRQADLAAKRNGRTPPYPSKADENGGAKFLRSTHGTCPWAKRKMIAAGERFI